MELNSNIGQIMDELGAEEPKADNRTWLQAYPDAAHTLFRGLQGAPFEGGSHVPDLKWWRIHPSRSALRRNDVVHRLQGDNVGDGRSKPPTHNRVKNDVTGASHFDR